MREVDNEEDLAAVLRISDRVFVLFYASWCPFCREFLPIFEECFGKSCEESLRVKIDDEMNPLWERYEVMAVPTVILFKGGNAHGRLDGVLGSGLSEEQLKNFKYNYQNADDRHRTARTHRNSSGR
jgi:thioredoxin 1